MLKNFPTEILEEVLLDLPLKELVRMMKTNSRIYKIASNPRSPLRHRFECKDFYEVYITTFGPTPGNGHSPDCTSKRIERVEVKICTKTTEGWAALELYFWDACSCRQETVDAIFEPAKLSPARIVKFMKEKGNTCELKARVMHDSLDAALRTTHLFLLEFFAFFRACRSGVMVNGCPEIFYRLSGQFAADDYPALFDWGLLGLFNTPNFDSERFFSSSFFKNGIDAIEFVNLTDEKVISIQPLLHNSLKNLDSLLVEGNLIQLGDAHLLGFIELEMACIELETSYQLTASGIATAIKVIVESSEPDEGIHIKIKDLPFTINEVLAEIEEDEIEWENGGRRAVIFNGFGQMTEIDIDENSIFELTKLLVDEAQIFVNST